MDAGAKSQIIILVCFLCFVQSHSASLQDILESAQNSEIIQKFSQNGLKKIVKRNADWSKRLHSSLDIETPAQVAEGSENIEVTSKLPRVIRRMRVQQAGGQQNTEVLKQMNPESRFSEGGTKVVRVKKFKRKQVRKTTVAPETTVRVFTPRPAIVNTGETSSSPYSHITVINKEVRNPKKKKNKKKKINDQYVPTPSYFPEPKQNGRLHVTASPEMHQISAPKHVYNIPNSYPNFGRTNYENHHPIVNDPQTNFQKAQGILKSKQNEASEFEYVMSQGQQPDFRNRNVNFSVRKSVSMKAPKNSVHIPDFMMYSQDNPQQLTASESRHESVRNVSKETEKIKKAPDVNTEAPRSTEDKSIVLTTVSNVEDSPHTTAANLVQESVSEKGKSQTASVRDSNIGSVLRPNEEHTTLIYEKPKQQHYLFPSRFPSLLQSQKDLFSDPFFDDQGMHSPLHGPSQKNPYQFMSPMNLGFSPFHRSSDPQGSEHGNYPHRSNPSAVHGLRQSPHITSLRRSILDSYEDDATTSEPITPFSLPKFEIPQIDFDDKGCQTVYKEVKIVPAGSSKTARNDEKSFVLSRECYFPNGLPTAKPDKKVEMTPSVSAAEESNDQREDLKTNTD